MKILVTAGPTREHLDPVRFISNASSGRMGISLAGEAHQRGHDVTLILGPTSLQPDPEDLRLQNVTTAEEMHRAVFERFDDCDMLIMTAAVTDIRPRHRSEEKRPKETFQEQIEVEPTPDILREAGERKGDQVVIGFAVESQRMEERGRTKFREKNLDLIVINRPEAMGARNNRVHLIDGSGPMESWPEKEKRELAADLLDRFLQVAGA